MQEQEQEREERARLDEILQMCADYQRQIDEERHPASSAGHDPAMIHDPSVIHDLAIIRPLAGSSSKPPPSPAHNLHPNRYSINLIQNRRESLERIPKKHTPL